MPILGSRGAASVKAFGFTGGPAKGLINATGGTITCDGDYRIHTFTGPGTFCVACICACVPAPTRKVDYLILGGGGAGGQTGRSGGGGAGGFRESHEVPISGTYTASPVATSNSQTIAAGGYPIAVGSGGSPANPPTVAPNTTAFGISTTGGGQGAQEWNPGQRPGGTGGSGGGGGNEAGSASNSAGSGNAGGYSPPEGNPGGGGSGSPGGPWYGAGGGGGGAATSGSGAPSSFKGGNGGVGHGTAISPEDGTPGPDGALRYFSGGGGGKSQAACVPTPIRGTGGYGGGGGQPGSQVCGMSPVCVAVPVGEDGTGGGAAFGTGAAGAVIIRYKFK